jgi:hypothetical protein
MAMEKSPMHGKNDTWCFLLSASCCISLQFPLVHANQPRVLVATDGHNQQSFKPYG